ncbi:MAG: beta-ketoacyl-[acyl-carrier-protein] synthase family protein [Solirubrobacterales bacterium]
MSDAVAITGVGAVTPLGTGAEELFSGWLAGRSAIVDGEARCDFDPADFLSRREVRNADRFAALAIAAAEEAIEQAGWHEGPPDPERTVCVIATAAGGMYALEEERARFFDRGPGGVSPLGVTRQMANGAAAMLSIRHGWTGESFGLVSACAAGAQAVGAGVRMIRSGAADAAVVGGSDSGFIDLYRAFFDVLGAISPSGTCRPFDHRHDGFIPGEGAGVMLLEDAAAAAARGASVLGHVVGYGASSDASHLAVPRADGQGARSAMKRAIEDADITAEQVSYVNAHGTSTPRNDGPEAVAIRDVLGPNTAKVSSLKSSTGHLQGAAGAVEAVATLYALRAGLAPATVGLEEPIDCELDLVRGEAAELERSEAGLIGLSNSLGLGGHNATLAIKAA